MPKLSVVIPVKNGMPYLEEAVNSVICCEDIDLELIISNDNSSDTTSQYLSGITDSRVRIVLPPHSMKVDEHWSFVCSLANGEYIKLLCADDYLMSTCLRDQVNILDKHQEVCAVISLRNIVNSKSRTIIKSHGGGGLEGIQEGSHAIRKSLIIGTNIFGEPSSLMFRRKDLIENLPWDSKLPYMLDFELYSRMFIGKKLYFSNSIHTAFRIHGNSITALHSKDHFFQFTEMKNRVMENNPNISKFTPLENVIFILNTFLKTAARLLIIRMFSKF